MRSRNQRDTLLALRGALRTEAHILERWPHLVAQQLHHRCVHGGRGAAQATAILERVLEGRRWIRRTTYFARPVCAAQWSLGRGHDILAARLTSDGRYVVALAQAICAVWGTEHGDLVSELAFGDLGAASSLALAPGGEAIGIGHRNGHCSIWDFEAGSLLHRWQADESAIEALALSDAPRRAATCAGSMFQKRVRIWEPPSNHVVRERVIEDLKILELLVPGLQTGASGAVRDPGAAVRCLGLDFVEPQSCVVFAQPGAAQVWDWSRDETVWRTERSPQRLGGGAVSFEDEIVAAQGSDGTNRFIIVDGSGKVEPTSAAEAGAAPPLGSVAKVVFSSGGDVYVAANARHECRIGWRVASRWHERTIDLGGAGSFDISADGRLVIGVNEDRCSLFEVSALEVESAADFGLDGDVKAGAFTKDGGACTMGGYREFVHLQIPSSTPSWRSSLTDGGLSGLAWAAGAPVLAASGRDGSLVAVVNGSRRDETSMRSEDQEFTCVAISSDGERIAAGCVSGEVRIWDRTTSGEGRSFPVWERAVTAVSWLGTTSLAVAGESEEVRVVNCARPRRQISLRAHEAWVTCLVGFSEQGVLLSGGLDGRVCLWEPKQSAQPRAVWRDRIEPLRITWLSELQLLASVDARGLLRLRSEDGEDAGLCALDGPAVALEYLHQNRLGYINRSGEVTMLDIEGASQVARPGAPLSEPPKRGGLWGRWRTQE